jgi:hypothetical protein
MSKVFRSLALVLALAVVVGMTGSPVRAEESPQTVARDFEGPKLLPDCKAPFQLSPGARRAVGDAVLTFQAIILKDGTVGFVELMNDDRPYPGVEQAAKDSLRNWKYEPGKLGGVPVNAGVTISVQFRGASLASSTRPATAWSARELGSVLPPLDKVVFSGGREDEYFPQSQPQDYGYDTARDTPCTGNARSGCWYVPGRGPLYEVEMPLTNASGGMAR